MYIVTIKNNGIEREMHGKRNKLSSGNIVQGINAIDSFTATILPSNPAFNELFEYKTLISIYNTNKNRNEFYGRLLYSNPSMDEDGKISKNIIFESYFGFLQDSEQTYVAEKNWAVRELLEHIIEVHNSQIEDYKKFYVGEVTVTDPNDNLYIGIQRKKTFDTIKEKLIDKLGGEIRFRVEDDKIYIDYLIEIGETKTTSIALSKNMKSIQKEKDPSAYITRLIPLGSKLTNDTEDRLDITSVNGGKNYIDDEDGIKEYGLHVGSVEFDDVTEAKNLLAKGQQWLVNNNKVKIKYAINALDLSLLELDIDDFKVGNYYPVINNLIGINDIARVIKKSINVCDEVKSTIEVGENFKTLQEIIIEKQRSENDIENSIKEIKNNYVPNHALTSESERLVSLIEQGLDNIVLSVSETHVTIEANEEFKSTIETQFKLLQDEILMKFTSTEEQIVEVDGEAQSKFEEIYKYISFSPNGIKLGDGSSSITIEIENDIISFKKNGLQFGYWDGENFHTGNIFVDVNERAQFGNYAFVPRSDGSLSLLKVRG